MVACLPRRPSRSSAGGRSTPTSAATSMPPTSSSDMAARVAAMLQAPAPSASMDLQTDIAGSRSLALAKTKQTNQEPSRSPSPSLLPINIALGRAPMTRPSSPFVPIHHYQVGLAAATTALAPYKIMSGLSSPTSGLHRRSPTPPLPSSLLGKRSPSPKFASEDPSLKKLKMRLLQSGLSEEIVEQLCPRCKIGGCKGLKVCKFQSNVFYATKCATPPRPGGAAPRIAFRAWVSWRAVAGSASASFAVRASSSGRRSSRGSPSAPTRACTYTRCAACAPPLPRLRHRDDRRADADVFHWVCFFV